MASMQHAFLANCCESMGQCCSTITGVWYLCLAIVVMVLLISCNDLLKSQCHFIGFPWSKSKLYYVHETVVDEEFQILLVYDDVEGKEQHTTELVNRPPPPPYSVLN